MRTTPRIIIVVLSFLSILVVIVTCLNSSITTNISISEPLGYYLTLPIVNNIKRNDKYLICINSPKYLNVLHNLGLPNNANDQCSSGFPYLIKQVVGIPGDTVHVTQNGILINNRLQPNSKSFVTGRGIALYPLPIGYKVILGAGEYFMLGVTPHSVDSRYFGIIRRKQLQKQAILIFRES